MEVIIFLHSKIYFNLNHSRYNSNCSDGCNCQLAKEYIISSKIYVCIFSPCLRQSILCIFEVLFTITIRKFQIIPKSSFINNRIPKNSMPYPFLWLSCDCQLNHEPKYLVLHLPKFQLDGQVCCGICFQNQSTPLTTFLIL